MPIIRRKLDPAEVYAENIRYDAETDAVQSLINGEWVDNPEADSRTQTLFPPIFSTEPRCDAAESAKDAFKGQIESVTTAISEAKTIYSIAGLILALFTFGIYAIFIAVALFIANVMLEAGTLAIEAAFTPTVYHLFACILYCNMNSQGRLIPDSLGVIKTQIDDQIGGLAATILKAMLDLAGEGGVNNLASLGTSVGDCSECGCEEPCPLIDWVVGSGALLVRDDDFSMTISSTDIGGGSQGVAIYSPLALSSGGTDESQCCTGVRFKDRIGGDATEVFVGIRCGYSVTVGNIGNTNPSPVPTVSVNYVLYSSNSPFTITLTTHP